VKLFSLGAICKPLLFFDGKRLFDRVKLQSSLLKPFSGNFCAKLPMQPIRYV